MPLSTPGTKAAIPAPGGVPRVRLGDGGQPERGRPDSLSLTAHQPPAATAADRRYRDQRTQADQRTLVLVVLVVAAIYAVIIGLSTRRYGGNLSALIDAGEKVVKTEPGALG